MLGILYHTHRQRQVGDDEMVQQQSHALQNLKQTPQHLLPSLVQTSIADVEPTIVMATTATSKITTIRFIFS